MSNDIMERYYAKVAPIKERILRREMAFNIEKDAKSFEDDEREMAAILKRDQQKLIADKRAAAIKLKIAKSREAALKRKSDLLMKRIAAHKKKFRKVLTQVSRLRAVDGSDATGLVVKGRQIHPSSVKSYGSRFTLRGEHVPREIERMAKAIGLPTEGENSWQFTHGVEGVKKEYKEILKDL